MIRIASLLALSLLLLGAHGASARDSASSWTNPEGRAGKIRVIRGAERDNSPINIIRGTPAPPLPAPARTPITTSPAGFAAAIATSPRSTTALLDEGEALWIVPRRGLPTACYLAIDAYGARVPVCTRAVRRTTVFGGY